MENAGAKSGSESTMHQGATADGRFSTTNQPACFQGGKRPRYGGQFRMKCPYCDALAKVRGSEQVSPTYRSLRFQCVNVESDEPCGASFIASLVIERVLVPTARPNPRVQLPMAVLRRRMPSGAPVPANDQA